MTNQLTSDEQQFVDATRRYPKTTYRKDEVNRLLAIIDRLTTTQPAAPDDDPPDPPSCRWCDGTGTTLTGKVEDCPYCNGTGYADGEPRVYGTAEPPQPAAPAPTAAGFPIGAYLDMLSLSHAIAEQQATEPPTDTQPAIDTLTAGQTKLLNSLRDGRYLYRTDDGGWWCDIDTNRMFTESIIRPLIKAGYLEEDYDETNDDWRVRGIKDAPLTKRVEHVGTFGAYVVTRDENGTPVETEAAPAPTPRPVKLTARQREYLQLAVKHGGEIHHRNGMYIAAGRGNAAVMKGLVTRGLMARTATGWEITAQGRAALDGGK